MGETKACLKSLAVCLLLLSLNILPNADIIPGRFPVTNLSSIYLMVLAVCLILRYAIRVAQRGRAKRMMLGLAGMVTLLILLRGIKYSVFGDTFFLARYTWYLYYVPLLLIPLFLLCTALFLYAKDERGTARKGGWVSAATVLLILFVLTNDLHQCVFRFEEDYINWDRDYAHGWGYYLVTAWQFGLFAAGEMTLVAKCSVANTRHQAWLILLPFVTGLGLILLSVTGTMPEINGVDIIQFPEAYCFMAVGVLECCMQLGLIPTKEHYRELMQISSLPVMITDRAGKAIYRSGAARELTEEQFRAPDGSRTDEHTILRRMSMPGGYGFWQEDVEELDRLNAELEEARDALSEEAVLTRLQNTFREKQTRIKQRTEVYDRIAGRTERQSQAISQLARRALSSNDAAQRDRYRKRIVLIGSFIKRYANLMLLASEGKGIATGEMGLALAEVLRYLNLYGIPGELINTADGVLDPDGALHVFEAFEYLLEKYLTDMTGLCCYLSGQKTRNSPACVSSYGSTASG